MNRHTMRARDWLDRRYRRDSQGEYLAHQPIFGLDTSRSEPNTVLRFARTYRLLGLLDCLEFESVLDVGGGEGYLAALVRDLFGPRAVHASDLSVEACLRAREIFDLQGLVADVATLPFADGSYDLVVCSEVIEHLSTPVYAISELMRVARRFVVLSTSEFCPTGALERWLRLRTLDREYPHSELNWFTIRDFKVLMGDHVQMCSQFRSVGHLIADRHFARQEMIDALNFLTATDSLDVDHDGVVVVVSKDGDFSGFTPSPREERAQRIISKLLEGPARRTPANAPAAPEEDLLHRLQCPTCRQAKVRTEGGSLRCACGGTYDVVSGIPVMLTSGTSSAPNEAAGESLISQLAGSSFHRVRHIRKLAAKLHCTDLRHNNVLVQRVAAGLLRVVWLLCRKEPLRAKVTRVVRRLVNRVPLVDEQLQALLISSGPPRA